jgi:alpha-L-rhamnosidase
MLGHAETWLYGGLGGLRVDFDQPAGSRIRIAPQVVGGIESTSVRYSSVLGEVAAEWRKVQGRLQLRVEIPPGATAQIELPATGENEITEGGAPLQKVRGILRVRADARRVTLTVGSGRYSFEVSRRNAAIRSR